jgi:hypothetical protein
VGEDWRYIILWQLWALLFRIENGRIVEAVNFPGDQHAADAFFWRVYALKPIPDRLSD